MQAASRASLADAEDQLAGTWADGSADDLRTAGDGLLAVAKLLHREFGLRRALADPSASAERRRALAEQVFGGKVDDRTLDVLRDVVARRWSRSSDLLDALELLGISSILVAADKGGRLADVEDELFRFSRAVAGNGELAATLGDPAESADRRSALVADLIGDRAHPATVRLAELAVAGIGGRNFEASLDRLVVVIAERRGRQLAHVTVPTPVPDVQMDRLSASLERTYGRPMDLQVEIDPEILGGMIIRIGNDLYDGSVSRRLDVARSELTG